jgi:hypothetical protein
MARNNGGDLDALLQERAALEQKLAGVSEKIKEAEVAQRDAGKPVVIAAINRVKIADMSRDDAKQIANALAKHGGATVASWIKAREPKASA